MSDSREGPVLDASALVARLLGEVGADTVEVILAAGGAITTPLAVAETLRTCRRRGFAMDPDEILRYLESRHLRVEPVLPEDMRSIAANIALSDAYRASDKKAGALSIADATCIAVAQRLGVPVVVSDEYWSNLDVAGVDIIQFR